MLTQPILSLICNFLGTVARKAHEGVVKILLGKRRVISVPIMIGREM